MSTIATTRPLRNSAVATPASRKTKLTDPIAATAAQSHRIKTALR